MPGGTRTTRIDADGAICAQIRCKLYVVISCNRCVVQPTPPKNNDEQTAPATEDAVSTEVCFFFYLMCSFRFSYKCTNVWIASVNDFIFVK